MTSDGRGPCLYRHMKFELHLQSLFTITYSVLAKFLSVAVVNLQKESENILIKKSYEFGFILEGIWHMCLYKSLTKG